MSVPNDPTLEGEQRRFVPRINTLSATLAVECEKGGETGGIETVSKIPSVSVQHTLHLYLYHLIPVRPVYFQSFHPHTRAHCFFVSSIVSVLLLSLLSLGDRHGLTNEGQKVLTSHVGPEHFGHLDSFFRLVVLQDAADTTTGGTKR